MEGILRHSGCAHHVTRVIVIIVLTVWFGASPEAQVADDVEARDRPLANGGAGISIDDRTTPRNIQEHPGSRSAGDPSARDTSPSTSPIHERMQHGADASVEEEASPTGTGALRSRESVEASGTEDAAAAARTQAMSEGKAAYDGATRSREAAPLGTDAGLLQLGRDDEETTPAQPKQHAGGAFADMLVMLREIAGPLAIVLGILLIGFYFFRRVSSGGISIRAGQPAGILEILGRYPLGKRQYLVLLKIDRRVLLLHQNGDAMTTLTELADPHEVASILTHVEASERDRRGNPFQRALTSANDRLGTRDQQIETVDLTRRTSTGLLRTLHGA